MSQTEDLHRRFLTEIEQEIAGLETRLAELRTVAKYHAARAGEPRSNGAGTKSPPPDFVPAGRVVVPDELAGKTRYEQAEALLRQMKKPLRASEMAAMIRAILREGTDIQSLQNALFTSMVRKPETFVKIDRGLWGLVEWTVDDSAEEEKEGITDDDF